mmetsp:Transcript_23374/g.67359  ORF Transcript_23374/g.67359 Transcript_23374/m.67359 type:complete len:648 (-) Transcript_23374:123-2066(-)
MTTTQTLATPAPPPCCGRQSSSDASSSNIVTLHRLEAPPLSSLLPSEYKDWGLCGTCGVQTHEVFLRRDGNGVNGVPTTSKPGTSSDDGETNAIDDSDERVQLPMTIPGTIQLGRCLTCRPRRRRKTRSSSKSGSRSKSNSQRRGRRNRLDEEPGTDDEVSDKSLFPDLLAEESDDVNQQYACSEDTTHGTTSTSSGSTSEDNGDDDASTVVTCTCTSPSLLSTPHPLTATISHISHISHGSEPSQAQSLVTESSESSEESAGLWSIESGESEDSLLRRVVSFAANTATATTTTGSSAKEAGDAKDATAPNTSTRTTKGAAANTGTDTAPLSPPSALRYKRRTQDNDSIGTSIATSLVSSHASFSSNSSSSSDDSSTASCSSDEDTIVSGNCSPGRCGARKKSILKSKHLVSSPPMPLGHAHRTRSAPAPPGKLTRDWDCADDDPVDTFLTSRGAKRNISLPTNIDQFGGRTRNGSTGTSPSAHDAAAGDQHRPKWTAKSAILTHEEELQAMLQAQCSTKRININTNDDDDDDTIDSTSGDIGCMAARLRKQYGIHRISFASGDSTTSSSSADGSTASESSNCTGDSDSGKASSLLSGVTASTASVSSASSSRWVTQSQEGEKKNWNRKVLGFFAADKILGRHRVAK